MLSFFVCLLVFCLFVGLTSGVWGGFFVSFVFLIAIISMWGVSVGKESRVGLMSSDFSKGARFAFILFITSEVMFFASFFWSFFTFAFVPVVEGGSEWPQNGIEVIDGLGVPLLNTIILLSSGVTVTWVHKGLLHGNTSELTKSINLNSKLPLALTVALGVVFLFVQGSEYASASFSISDGAYGTGFFMLTGFHGFHVFLGCLLLSVCLMRFISFSGDKHVGLETSIWYWHFVDVVWLFLFCFIYVWSQGFSV